MDGLLLVDKPKGWTSFDVVAKVRGIVRQTGVNKPKVGHTGTLDPLATGLLIVTLGSYCKKAAKYSKLDKVYEVEMKLGVTSTTDDEEGQKTFTNRPIPPKMAVEEAILGFVGIIEQTPPSFSAIKVDGKRAYKLARKGIEVKIEPRKTTIYSINNIAATGDRVAFTTKVSSGTYIRSLVRDIGQKLGCSAYMLNLRRTHIGAFDIKDAHQIDLLTAEAIGHTVITDASYNF